MATPHVKEWNRKRHESRVEGERHLEAGNYGEAERYLTVAIAQAEQRRYPVAKRNALRLKLAEAQRQQGKVDDAERSARLAKVARLYLHWERYGPARELVTQAITRLERKQGRRLATALETLAQLEDAAGRMKEAGLLRDRALTIAAGNPT